MNRKTLEVFHSLMKNGWIDRREDSHIWGYSEDMEVQEELEDFKAVLGIDFVRAGDRLYLVPTQENDLFLKNNQDFRRDIRADNTIRNRDLYLMNYLAIYLIYVFFSGEGNDPLCRDFISKEDFISQFTQHCNSVAGSDLAEGEEAPDYSENFIRLAEVWMSKIDGAPDSQKFDTRYGILNRILAKFKTDELFSLDDDDRIRPTRKLKDLMPYFLRKDRISEIQAWIKEAQTNAENQ